MARISGTHNSQAGDTWNYSQMASLQYDNPTCGCAAPGNNFAVSRQPNIGFYVDVGDYYQAGRIGQWLQTAAPWWNDKFSWVGSSKRIDPLGGAWPVQVTDLHSTYPNAMMMFSNVNGYWHIEIDQTAFLYSDDQNTTWIAHELGHAVGADHSPCSEDQSLMSAVVNGVHWGVDQDAEKCWMYSEYSNLGQTCNHW